MSKINSSALAAQQNPQTGPRTAEGKARSAQNARKHGLTSAAPFINDEDRPAYDEFEAALRNETHPSGVHQEIAFLSLLANAWNLQRLTRFEAQCDDLKELLKLQRYRTAAERGYHRAFKEIATLQSDAITAPIYREMITARAFTKRNPPDAQMPADEPLSPEDQQLYDALKGRAGEVYQRWQEEQAKKKSA